MRVGNFSLMIPEGTERDSGHVEMAHGRQFTVLARSHVPHRCDAEVSIDGKEVGVFRLEGRGTLYLERPPNDQGRFTFYTAGSGEAEAAGEAKVKADDRGLVRVRFVPERPRPVVMRTTSFKLRTCAGPGGQSMSMFSSDAEEKTSGGITGLSGHSGQQFHTVGPIDRDEANAVTITVRLIHVERPTDPRPLVATTAGNPVPPPV